MEFIAHRINTIVDLRNLSKEFGVELDLRDDLNGNIYIQHNPFELGESFEEYLDNYQHGTMILNIKSERIEHKVIELIKQHRIEHYFFLDSSFPMIYTLSNEGERNIALRFSEYEGLDTVRKMSGKVEWIWVDCFSQLPLNKEICEELSGLGYKICIVSPELQGRDCEIEVYAKRLKGEGISVNAICTKSYNIERWKSILES